MFQRDDFTLSVLTGNQPCQFVLVKKELMKLICEHFCPCYAVPMQHDKCVSATTTRPTSPQVSIAKRNKPTTYSHSVNANGDSLLFLSNLCLSCSSKASENVPLKSPDGRFLSRKSTRMTCKKDEKYGDLLKLRTNPVDSMKTKALACTRRSIPNSQVWTAR